MFVKEISINPFKNPFYLSLCIVWSGQGMTSIFVFNTRLPFEERGEDLIELMDSGASTSVCISSCGK
jgi:hypothetical protein